MEPLGPKIAAGRDSEIFEHGPGRVLRRSFVPRDLTNEARTMAYVRERGFPVPEVFEAGHGFLVMERVEGRDMLDALPRTPAGLAAGGRELARLHNQLGAIPAPDWLEAAPGAAGDAIVHLDLHPMNVMSTADGPIVIDWGNAKRGVPAVDVANTWALLKSGQITGFVDRIVVALGRRLLLNAFLGDVDQTAAARQLAAVVDWRAGDRNMSPTEIARMRKLVAKAS